ncbi:MAG: TonB-dependent receptor [Saccharospirillaceae bacterium]|nr:hypothetical protein [Pseudomonadales bacterium]NRB80413.1 TonB-dependent receptor [Saccharospirillaceae bacterium]
MLTSFALADDQNDQSDQNIIEPPNLPVEVSNTTLDPAINNAISQPNNPENNSNSKAPIELENVTVQSHDPVTQMTPETQKLFSLPGSAGDPITGLQALPGIVSASRVKGEPAVRGSSPEDNHYLVDDLPVPYLFHLLGYSIFSESVVQNFDIQTGAFPAYYSEGTGAALHVGLRRPKIQKIHTALDLGMFKSSIFIEGSFIENQSFYLNYRKSTIGSVIQAYTSLTDKDENETNTQNTSPTSDDLYAKYNWQINANNNLDFHFSGALDGFKIEPLSFEELQESPEQANISLRSQPKYASTGLTWNHQTANNGQLVSSAGNVYYIVEKELPGFFKDKLIENTFLVKSNYNWSFNNQHQFRTGLKIKHSAVDYFHNLLDQNELDSPLTINAGDKSLIDFLCGAGLDCGEFSAKQGINFVHAFFEDTWFINNQFSLTSGIHTSYDDYLKEAILQPRIRLDYDTYDELNVFTAFGQHSQYPKYEQILPGFGNQNLKQQKANHFVIGAKKIFYSGWSVKSEAYYKDISNIVVDVNNDHNPQTEDLMDILELIGFDFIPTGDYKNSGTGTAYGVELLVEKEKINKFSGWLALSLSKSERTDNNIDGTYLFELDKPVVLDFITRYDLNERWNISSRFNMQSGQLYTPITGASYNAEDDFYIPDIGKPNSKRGEFEHSLDVRLQYTKTKANSEFVFYLDVFNIYNRKKTMFYTYNEDYSEVERIESPLGLLPLFGIKYSF